MEHKTRKLYFWPDEIDPGYKVQLEISYVEDIKTKNYFINSNWTLIAEGENFKNKNKILLFKKSNVCEKEINNLLSFFEKDGFKTAEAS